MPDRLDERIRAVVVQIVDTSPLPPSFDELEELRAMATPARRPPNRPRVARRRIALAALAVLVIVGLVVAAVRLGDRDGSTRLARQPEPQVKVVTPPGYQTITVKRAGFSVALPKRWAHADTYGLQGEANYAKFGKAHPALAAALGHFDGLQAAGVRLVAGERTGGSYPTNLAVYLTPGVPTVDEARVRGIFAEQQIKNYDLTTITLAGTPTVLVTNTSQVTTSSGAMVTVHATQYWLLDKYGMLTVDVESLNDGLQDPTIHTIVQSLRLLP